MFESIQNRTPQWWKPKASNILSLVYFGIFYSHHNVIQLFILIPLAICTLLGIGISGYIFNDWADKESDFKAGKTNKLAGLNAFQFVILLSFALLLSWFPWIFLPKDHFSFILLAVQWFLLLSYAFPPLRLKERPLLSILADALYAYAIPAVLAFYTFSFYSNTKEKWALISILFIWQLLVGMQNYLIHIISDYENDEKSGTKTAATIYGQYFVNKIRIALIIPSLVLFFLFLFLTNLPLWYLIVACVIFLELIYVKVSRYNIRVLRLSLSPDLMQVLNFNIGSIFAWTILFYLSFTLKFGLIFLALHVILFEWNKLKGFFTHPYVKYPLSIIVNHSIYWVKRIFLMMNDKNARGRDFDAFNLLNEKMKKRKEEGCIAVFNKNYKKYTETFVQGQIDSLEMEFDVFHGEGLPTLVNGGKILYQDGFSIWLRYSLELFCVSENYFLNRFYSQYFRKNNVKIAVVQFGTTAVEVIEMLKENGIPMIVVFYGYDAWHADILDRNKIKYQDVFSYSSKIIGVSRDICKQLVKLGADETKVVYIPCYVNTNLFTYNDHSKNENIILAVGRFTETKSPHLTILAFSEVLKKVPDARLVMIGKDGGGELFEACIILARALKIENKIDFKGICTPEQVKEQMDNAKVFVQHSITTPLNGDKEGTPVAVMEALLSGLPIVATKHAGIIEMIEDGVNGYLVEEYDYLGMAEKICFCLDHNFDFNENYITSLTRFDIFNRKFNKLVYSIL